MPSRVCPRVRRTCRAACVAMHWRQKAWEQPSLIAPPSEPQTSMHTAQSCLLPPSVRGHHGLCCILDFFLSRCGVPAKKQRCSGFGQLALRRLLSAPGRASVRTFSLSGGSSERQAAGPCCLHGAAPLFPRLPGVAALLVFLSLGVVLSTKALLRSTGANAERAEDRVLRRCISL